MQELQLLPLMCIAPNQLLQLMCIAPNQLLHLRLGLEGHGVHLQIRDIKGIMVIEGIKITYDIKLNKSTSTE